MINKYILQFKYIVILIGFFQLTGCMDFAASNDRPGLFTGAIPYFQPGQIINIGYSGADSLAKVSILGDGATATGLDFNGDSVADIRVVDKGHYLELDFGSDGKMEAWLLLEPRMPVTAAPDEWNPENAVILLTTDLQTQKPVGLTGTPEGMIYGLDGDGDGKAEMYFQTVFQPGAQFTVDIPVAGSEDSVVLLLTMGDDDGDGVPESGYADSDIYSDAQLTEVEGGVKVDLSPVNLSLQLIAKIGGDGRMVPWAPDGGTQTVTIAAADQAVYETVLAGGPDSCVYAKDTTCDEPAECHPGTDTTDCGP